MSLVDNTERKRLHYFPESVFTPFVEPLSRLKPKINQILVASFDELENSSPAAQTGAITEPASTTIFRQNLKLMPVILSQPARRRSEGAAEGSPDAGSDEAAPGSSSHTLVVRSALEW